ncbi:MAG: hypothetical protein ACP5M9_01545 [Candidatus Micrarchaeia archaeon]
MSLNRQSFVLKDVMMELNILKSTEYLEDMKRFGINTTSTITLGVSVPNLRKLSKR